MTPQQAVCKAVVASVFGDDVCDIFGENIFDEENGYVKVCDK